jgi:deoxyribose-phosphate aldolase
MIRPGMVSMARMMISDANSNVEIGTVIDFQKGGQDWRLSLMKRFRQFRMMLMI